MNGNLVRGLRLDAPLAKSHFLRVGDCAISVWVHADVASTKKFIAVKVRRSDASLGDVDTIKFSLTFPQRTPLQRRPQREF